MKDKLKWIGAAVAAFVLGLLALIYGKKTTAVLRAKVRAHNAKGRVLEGEIAVAEKKAAAATSEVDRKVHVEKANVFRLERDKVEKARDELLEETGDLPEMDDAELAAHHNRSGSAVGS